MFKMFKEKKEPKNIEELLNYFEVLDRKFQKISTELENIKKQNQFSIQKIGIVRFNPYKEIGGNQSFSIALLNGQNDGLVITSLYYREGNRFYGKSIENGGSQYSLSKEEQLAIKKAKKPE